MQQVLLLLDGETSPEVLVACRSLTFEAFGDRFTDDDWEHTRGGWRVVALDGDAVVSHAAVVARVLWVAGRAFQAGYLEGVATRPDRQRQGWGSRVMAQASALVRQEFELGGLSTGRADFYCRFGWEPWRGPTFVRVDEDLVRTPEEDDGVMVLRFGPSAGIDLEAPISCGIRSGDDW